MLRGAERERERLGALAIVPGAMRASDRVVMRDRPTAREDSVARGRLDLRPRGELVAAGRRRDERVVGRDAVHVRVGEAARHEAGRAARRDDRRVHGAGDRGVQALEAIPRAGRLERVGDDAERDERALQVRSLEERAPPRLGWIIEENSVSFVTKTPLSEGHVADVIGPHLGGLDLESAAQISAIEFLDIQVGLILT